MVRPAYSSGSSNSTVVSSTMHFNFLLLLLLHVENYISGPSIRLQTREYVTLPSKISSMTVSPLINEK